MKIKVLPDEDGKTLGDILVKRGVSRRLIIRLKRTDHGITCRGNVIRTIDTVHSGDEIILKEQDSSLLEPNGLLKVPVVYEDDDIIVFNKPYDMPVHPSIKHQGDTLGNYFASYCEGLTFRPVNRLDKDTSGLVVTAKNQYAAAFLQMKTEKVYYAVCHGEVDEYGKIDAPVAREKDSIIKRCVSENGQTAVTNYKRLKTNGQYSLCEIKLETGRTHQIRVHFSYIGHPLAGDDMYGGKRDDISRQALHCGKISFPRICDGKIIIAASEIPSDMILLTENK